MCQGTEAGKHPPGLETAHSSPLWAGDGGAWSREWAQAGLGSRDSLPGPSASLTPFAPWLLWEEVAQASADKRRL